MDEEIVMRLEEELAWKERELERLSREWYEERYDAPEVARLPVEERLEHWTDWALYLKQRIETHYRPRIAALEAELDRWIERCYETDELKSAALEKLGQAEAEAARLRCCGNCGHRGEETLDYYGSYFVCLTEFKPKTNMRHMEVDCEDQCQFTPSRWKEAER